MEIVTTLTDAHVATFQAAVDRLNAGRHGTMTVEEYVSTVLLKAVAAEMARALQQAVTDLAPAFLKADPAARAKALEALTKEPNP